MVVLPQPETPITTRRSGASSPTAAGAAAALSGVSLLDIAVGPRSCGSVFGWRFDMAAELEAHRREQALGEGVFLARAEARVECRGQDLEGNLLLDCGLDGPAALAGILLHPDEVGQRLILCKRGRAEIEQPGGDHAAPAPDLRDVGNIQLVARLR